MQAGRIRCRGFGRPRASHFSWLGKGLVHFFIELRFVAVQCIWAGFVARGVTVQRMQRMEDAVGETVRWIA